MVNTSFYHFNHQQYSHKSCVTVSYNKKSTIHSLYQQSLPLVKGGYQRPSTAQRSAALRRSSAFQPPTEVVSLLTVLCSVYIIIWLSLVSVYNNQRSISLDYPGQDRLPNWLSGAPQPQCFCRLHACTPSYCIPRADSVASSHSAPLRCYIVYILSQDCFGLLAGCQ